MFRHLLFLLTLIAGTFVADAHLNMDQYVNPITSEDCADPSILHAPDGWYYMSSGSHIFKSSDMTNWTHCSWAFDGADDPCDGHLGMTGGVWASDLNYINGQYVMYFSISVWGGEWTCGIAVATSDRPEGPYRWQKKLFTSSEIGVQNSIDPFYIEDNGRKYLFWGSFHGIYGVELSWDGLSVVSDKKQIAGAGFPEGIEGTCIYKRNGYYYLLGSRDTCCEELNSKYNLVVARADNLFGPYTNKWGSHAMYNFYELLVEGDDWVKGTGHCSEVIEDDNGNNWLIYHGYQVSNPKAGRVAYLAPIWWENDWPVMSRSTPRDGTKPAVKNLAPDVNEKYNFSARRGNSSAKGYDATKITAFCYRDGKLYCVYDFSKIIILEAQSGNLLGELPMNDTVAGGMRRISGIQEYYGSIVASNYAGKGDELRLYVWDGDRAQPRVFFSTTDLAGANALGESINVGGSWGDMWIASADGTAEPCVVEYHVVGTNVEKAYYPLKYEDKQSQHPLGSNAKVYMMGGTWWVDGNDCEPTYFGREDGKLFKYYHVPWVFNYGAGHQEFTYRNRKYSADVHFADGRHDGRLRLLIDDSGNYNSISTCGTWPADGLGANDNNTGIGDVITRTDGSTWVEMWVFSHEQGLAYFTVGTPPETSTEPQLNASPSSLEMNCYRGEDAAGTISFNGRNIDGLDISLSINGAAEFSLSKDVIRGGGQSDVQVYYRPGGVGTSTAVIEARLDDRLLCTVPVSGQCRAYVPDYTIDGLTQKWIYSANSGTLANAPWFNNSTVTRDICATNHNVYVLGYNGSVIDILDAETGAHKGQLSTEGISGGLIPLAGIGALGSSVVGVSASDANEPLNIYRWDVGSDTPVLWYSSTDHAGVQLGRTMNTYGDLNDGYIMMGFGEAPKGSNTQKIVIYHVSGGTVQDNPRIVDISASYTGGNTSNQHISMAADGTLWLSNKDTYPIHYDLNGNVIEKLDSGLTGKKTGVGTDVFSYAGRTYIAVTTSLGSSTNSSWGNGVFELLDITDGLSSAVHKGVYPAAGLGPDSWGAVGNSTVTHTVEGDLNHLNMFVLFPHQGIAAYGHADGYNSGVTDLVQEDAEEQWYTVTGRMLRERPSAPGIYIRRTGNRTDKLIIR